MVKNLFVTAAAAAAMSVPPQRTLPWWGFNPYRGIGRGDTSAGCRKPDGLLARRPVLTDRRGRRRRRRQSC